MYASSDSPLRALIKSSREVSAQTATHKDLHHPCRWMITMTGKLRECHGKQGAGSSTQKGRLRDLRTVKEEAGSYAVYKEGTEACGKKGETGKC